MPKQTSTSTPKLFRVPNGLTLRFYKELFYAVLAIASVLMVLYEYIAQPSNAVRSVIFDFDLVVALLFLLDFMAGWYAAAHRGRYLRSNWYLLLAAIPITEAWAELLRALRLFELLRLVRAGEHISYVWHEAQAVARKR